MIKSGLSLALVLALVSPAFAHEATVTAFPISRSSGQTANVQSTSNGGASHTAIDLNLSSTTVNMIAGRLLKGITLTIDVGGVSETVTSQTALTPAEYLAAMQVRSGNQQSLIIDAHGSASGGSVVINPRLSQAISNLTIPQGVTVIDLTRSGSINLGGSVTDDGSLFFTSFNPHLSTISVNAPNLTVQGQGILSDVLPAVGISLSHSPDSNLNLSLTSAGAIANAGTISSAGTLSLTVGSGTITNTGLISSTNGSINIATISPATDLNINAAGGTFQALAGNINLRDASYTGSNNINLTGGNYLSQNLNLYSGSGAINASLGQVTGQVNAFAQIAHVNAATPLLVLGSQILSGDPTYANTGDIDIDGPIVITGGANLAIVAGGNILSTNSSASITDNGGNVLLIAGANITSGGTGGATVSGSPPANPATSTITVSLSGGNGGNIDFAGITPGSTASTAATAIDTSSSSGAGGSVTLVALANGSTGGQVLFNNSSGTNAINTSGSGTSPGGQVTIFAGANSGTAIQTNNITTGGGSGGTVVIAATQATTNDGKSLLIDSTGTAVSLNSIVSGTSLTNGNISVGTIDSSAVAVGGNGGAVAISTGGSVTASGNITTSGAVVPLNIPGNGGNGGAVTVAAGQGIALQIVEALGGLVEGNEGNDNVGNGGNGGNAGAITLVTSHGDIDTVALLASGGFGGTNGGNDGAGGNGGAGGTIALAANTGNINVNVSGNGNGEVTGAGGEGGIGGVSGKGGAGGSGGSIIFSSGAEINVGSGTLITASGGEGQEAFDLLFGNGGSGGAITFTAGTSITTDSTSSISAEGASAGGSSAIKGNGGQVTLTAGTNIAVGTIATNVGSTGIGGIGGNVLLVAIGGSVGVGSSGASIAAINTSGGKQGGSVAVSASGTISLSGLDGRGNVINSSGLSGSGASVLLASGAATGSSIMLDGGNINTLGSAADFTGNAWILSSNGNAHGMYTLNSSTNPNDFTALPQQGITGTSGTTSITFTSGSAPTNFSPGGFSSINASGSQQIIVDAGGDSTLIVPIVTAGTFSIGTGASLQTNNATHVALFGNQGITVNGSLTTDSGAFNLSAIVDSSFGGVSVTSSVPLIIGTAASNGPLAVTTNGNSLTAINTITAATVHISAASVAFQNLSAVNIPVNVLATSGNINVQNPTSSLGLSGNGLFSTGAGGTTSFTTVGASAVLTLSNGTILTNTSPNILLQAPTVNLGTGTTINATASNGSITIQGTANGNLLLQGIAAFNTTSSGTTSFLSMSSTTSTLTVANGTTLTVNGGGQVEIRTPRLIFQSTGINPSITATGQSQIFLDGGDGGVGASVVPLTITGPAGASATIATNGGAIILHPTGDLEFANGGGGTTGTTINLNAFGILGAGLVDIQGLGNVTIDPFVTVSTNSPIQINLNAVQTVTLQSNSVLQTTFSGNATFPDPLGGVFQYSILIQNLITNFNIAGTGTILQAGATPGNTVFNDFVDVGFADGANLHINSSNPESFVNFFTRQIFVNGTDVDANPTASLSVNSNVSAINFNTNLPAPGPGDVAFQAGASALSATLNVSGAPVNVGFPDATPPTSIPSVQQPVGNIVFGLGGTFSLVNNQNISMFAASNIIVANSSLISSTMGNVTLQTTTGSNGNILIGGTITSTLPGGIVSIQADGAGNIVSAGGIVAATTVNLSSGTGSIGSAALHDAINTMANTLNASTDVGSVFINQTGNVTLLGASQAGPTGTFSLAASGNVQVSGTVSAGTVVITTGQLTNNGAIMSGSASGDSTTVNNPNGALLLAGTGTWTNPEALNLVAAGNLNVGNLFSASLPITTHSLTLTAAGGILSLPVTTLSVQQDSSGNGGSISVTAASVVLPSSEQPFVLNADATGTGSGGSVTVNLTGTAPITVGSGNGNIEISAMGGTSGAGGTASVSASENLIVNPAGININPGAGNGGTIDLVAGMGAKGGTLVVNAPLSADGTGSASGGTITLQSNSKTAFSVDSSKATNGTRGVLSVNGAGGGDDGAINVTNLGAGGVTELQPLTAVSQVTLSAGTNATGSNSSVRVSANLGSSGTTLITLNASGTGAVTGGAKNAITAATISASSENGKITLPDVVATSSTVNVDATTGSKGAISITNTGTGMLNLTGTGTTEAASLTVKSLGILSVSGSVSANNVTLQNTSTTGGEIDINSGAVVSAGTALTLTEAGSASTIMIDGSISSQKAIALSSTKGDITASDSSTINAGTTVKATALDRILAGGSITGTTGVTLMTTSSTGTNHGSITVGDITSGSSNSDSTAVGGAINVVAAGGTLTVSPSAVISANSGKTTKATITLENKLIKGTTTGNIVVDPSAQIETDGKLGGNVNIVMGAVPSAPKGSTLPSITGVNFTPGNPQSVIFVGATTINKGVNFVSSGTTNPINVSATGPGVKVIFNTGALPASAITINGGTTAQNPTVITADPPIRLAPISFVLAPDRDFVVDTTLDD
jgi:hypothetical protein